MNSIIAMDFYTLIAIGIVLGALEVFIYSFVLIWFALGFILVGIISLFYDFTNLYWQLATVALFSLLFLIFFRKSLLEKFLKPQSEISDNFFNKKGYGVIKNQKLFYKATYWEIEESINLEEFSEGEKVKVLEIVNNKAIIKKR